MSKIESTDPYLDRKKNPDKKLLFFHGEILFSKFGFGFFWTSQIFYNGVSIIGRFFLLRFFLLRFSKILKMLPPCGPMISAVRWSWMTNRVSRAIYSSRRTALEVHHQPVKTQTSWKPEWQLVVFRKIMKNPGFLYLLSHSDVSK